MRSKKKKKTYRIDRKVIRLLESQLYDDPRPGSAAEKAIEALHEERRLTWEELNRPACPPVVS